MLLFRLHLLPFRLHYPLLYVLIGFLLSATIAAETRPKIGLALGGGGAKGGAHIGVLKVLEQERIPVDYIAGTSIGSIVGAFYAQGYDAKEIEAKLLAVQWDKGYSDAIPREDLPYRKKQRGQFNLPFNVGLENLALKTPAGVLYGQNAALLLRQAAGNLPALISFDELPIPYRAIATDLSANEAVVLTSGDLLKAAQASSNVPGILAPVNWEGALLVDGGITNNIPIDVVKAMGADIVIAVDIGDKLVGAESLDTTFSVLGQLSSFLTVASSDKQKTLLSERDLLITPDITDLSTTDWATFPKSIHAGEKAAREMLTKLQGIRLDENQYERYRSDKLSRHRELLAKIESPVTSVELENQSSVHEAYIRDLLELDTSERIDTQSIVEAADRVYASDEFQRVELSLTDTEEEARLHVTTEEKSWGPNYLQFGLGWETNFTDESDINFGVAYTETNLTRYGGEWRSDIQIGDEQSLGTELYLPLTPIRSFYSLTYYRFENVDWKFFPLQNLELTLEENLNTVAQGLGYNFSNDAYVEVGALSEKALFTNDFAFSDDIKYDAYGFYLSLGYDNLNSLSFPTEGARLVFNATKRYEDVENAVLFNGEQTQFGGSSIQFELEWKGAFHVGNHAIVNKASASYMLTDDQEESLNATRLGGFLNLSGFDNDELNGPHHFFFALMYQYNLRENLIGDSKLPFYLGVSAETGNVWRDEQAISDDDLILAGSIYLGTSTQWGPVAIGYGANDAEEKSLYFYLGHEM